MTIIPGTGVKFVLCRFLIRWGWMGIWKRQTRSRSILWRRWNDSCRKDSNWGEYWWNASNTGYSMRKFLDPSYDATGTTMHTTPWFFIRLSEIYLNYAECQIELGNNLEALEYINKVRTRLLPPATGEDIRAEYEWKTNRAGIWRTTLVLISAVGKNVWRIQQAYLWRNYRQNLKMKTAPTAKNTGQITLFPHVYSIMTNCIGYLFRVGSWISPNWLMPLLTNNTIGSNRLFIKKGVSLLDTPF